MKILITIITLTFAISSAFSQDLLNNIITNSKEAVDIATKHNRDILMVFAGSDWCKPCIKFKKQILESNEFKTYSQNKLIILYLDFPIKKKNKLSKEQIKHNESLAEKYNNSGSFPKIILTDSAMKLKAEIAFNNQTAPQFIDQVKTKFASK